MANELEGAVIGENQGTICPETGAGAVGIEVVGNGVVGGIQRDGIPLSIHKAGNAGGKSVGLAISAAAVEELHQGITIQLKRAIFQVRNGISLGVVDGKRIFCPQHKVISKGKRAAAQGTTRHKSQAGKNRLAKEEREMEFHDSGIFLERLRRLMNELQHLGTNLPF